MRNAFYWAVWLCVAACVAGEEVKAPEAGVAFDLQGFIDSAVKAGGKKSVVPPGRYRVTPKRQQHLVPKDLQDIQIIADGVEMVCTETTRALTVSNCRNVTVRGLVIDYDPLPFTQGRIVKLSDDKKIREVELFAHDGKRLPDAKLVKAERDGKITDAEKAFLLKQRMDENIRTKWNADAWKLTLSRAVELPMGSLVASARRMGNGFLVQGCDFGMNRSRGILIKASDGKVIGNKLTGNWGPAILVSPGYWWLESGSSNNVEIRDNTITACRARAILVSAQGGQGLISGKPAPAGAHNNIAIANNTITECPLPNIEVTSTEGLRIAGNVFRAPVARPSGSRRDPEDRATDPATIEAVKTANCANVTLEKNPVK